jgi:hypothetical protein
MFGEQLCGNRLGTSMPNFGRTAHPDKLSVVDAPTAVAILRRMRIRRRGGLSTRDQRGAGSTVPGLSRTRTLDLAKRAAVERRRVSAAFTDGYTTRDQRTLR